MCLWSLVLSAKGCAATTIPPPLRHLSAGRRTTRALSCAQHRFVVLLLYTLFPPCSCCLLSLTHALPSTLMPSTMLPSAEWISASSRRRAASSLAQDRSSNSGGCCPPGAGHPTSIPPQPGSNDDDAHHQEERFVGHRGSGGLVHGRAVFCLPPGVEWFQGHFAYAARGGCTASLGVLGTELPVDPVSACFRLQLPAFRPNYRAA